MVIRLPRLRLSADALRFFLSWLVLSFALLIALPAELSFNLSLLQQGVTRLQPSLAEKIPNYLIWNKPSFSRLDPLFNLPIQYGLDIRGGTQVTLEANMSDVPLERRAEALTSTVEVIRRRVDLFGVAETSIRTAQFQDQYRVIVELPGIDQPEAALQLIGQTAQLQFRELPADKKATDSALVADFQPTELTGEQLERATAGFKPNTNSPEVYIEFDSDGARMFGEITERNVGSPVGIFLDEIPVSYPIVNEPIFGGNAAISGSFTLEEAKTLAAQLNAGALPVPITVIEQNTIGPTLGQESLSRSVQAGLVGLLIVALFMIVIYRWFGFIAVIGLIAYAILTVAAYKFIPVTLTLPGITGLLLSVGMAVDANILTFERIKEELRAGKAWKDALHLGFGRSWDSIKDANLATLSICFILFNPLEWGFLHTSGPIRGFALTLALGIVISLLTGVFFSRLLMKLFLTPPKSAVKEDR